MNYELGEKPLPLVCVQDLGSVGMALCITSLNSLLLPVSLEDPGEKVLQELKYLSFFCFLSAGCRLLLLQGHGWIQNHGNLRLQKGFALPLFLSTFTGAVLSLVGRFHTLIKLRYFCHLHDSGKFPSAHIGVVAETPKPLISEPVGAGGISPRAKAFLEFILWSSLYGQ